MDFTAILGALPTLGPIGLVLLILAYVGRQWMSSDKRYQAELERLRDAHKSELERINLAHEVELNRINKTHDDEIKELRADISELRREMSELRVQLNEERNARMVAQEEAHRIRIQSGHDLL